MALTADYVYQWSLKLIRKNQAGGLNSVEWAYHWNDAQSAYQDDLMGRFQRNNNGKEGMNTGIIEDDTILNKLLPFTKPINVLCSVGQAPKPTDWIYTLALRTNGSAILKVDHNTLWSVSSDVIDPPSVSAGKYYYTEYLNYYSILPNTVSNIDLDYISTPPDVLWAYVFDGNGRQVYNPAGSTSPLWDNSSAKEITKRMLSTLGVSLKDEDFEGFGQKVLTDGE